MLKQRRWHSLLEAVANTGVGYALAVLTQLAVFPQFGIEVTLEQGLVLGAILTVLSLVRSYTLRRVFEAWRMRQV
jgi:hypothetical protein